MLIVVTGALGFIGQEVVWRLASRGNRLVLVDHWDRVMFKYEQTRASVLETVYQTVSQAELVLRPSEFLEWLPSAAPDVIVHLGATVDTADIGESGVLFMNNVAFTRSLVKAANLDRPTSDVPAIVFASSAAVYGSKGFPNNPYGLTKAMGERIVAESRGEFSCLRLFNVFGKTEDHKGAMASMPFKIARAYRTGDRIDVHSLDSARDFVPVTTVADKISALAEMLGDRDLDEPEVREIQDLGTGHATTFADLDNFIMQATGHITSCVRPVAMPPQMEGRFQHFTQAGDRARNAGAQTQSTRDAIEELYGNRR